MVTESQLRLIGSRSNAIKRMGSKPTLATPNKTNNEDGTELNWINHCIKGNLYWSQPMFSPRHGTVLSQMYNWQRAHVPVWCLPSKNRFECFVIVLKSQQDFSSLTYPFLYVHSVSVSVIEQSKRAMVRKDDKPQKVDENTKFIKRALV